MFLKAVAKCQASATKCQASGATSIFAFCVFFLLKTRKHKEEKGIKKKILPSSLFFYFLISFSFLFFL
jgi:hypothetical protein